MRYRTCTTCNGTFQPKWDENYCSPCEQSTMTPTDEARVEAIAQKIDPEAWKIIPSEWVEGYWEDRKAAARRQAQAILAADPLTQEHAKLTADVVEVLELARTELLCGFTDNPLGRIDALLTRLRGGKNG